MYKRSLGSFCNIYIWWKAYKIDFAKHIHRLVSFCFVCCFSSFIVTHIPYVCYKLFKKFVFASLFHSFIHSFTLFLLHSPVYFFFFSGFSRRIFCIKQNGIFLALEEKIHSSTFISFLIHRPSIFNRNSPFFANLINLC